MSDQRCCKGFLKIIVMIFKDTFFFFSFLSPLQPFSFSKRASLPSFFSSCAAAHLGLFPRTGPPWTAARLAVGLSRVAWQVGPPRQRPRPLPPSPFSPAMDSSEDGDEGGAPSPAAPCAPYKSPPGGLGFRFPLRVAPPPPESSSGSSLFRASSGRRR